MAIFDAQFELFDAQVVTNADKTSTVIDLGVTDVNIGAGTPVWLVIKQGTVMAGGTSIVFTLYSHTASTGVTGGTAVWTITLTQAQLTAAGNGGYLVRMPLPYAADVEQYLALYLAQSGDFTSGTIDAWLDHGPQTDNGIQITTSNI